MMPCHVAFNSKKTDQKVQGVTDNYFNSRTAAKWVWSLSVSASVPDCRLNRLNVIQ